MDTHIKHESSKPIPYHYPEPVNCRYCRVTINPNTDRHFKIPINREVIYFHPDCYFILREKTLTGY